MTLQQAYNIGYAAGVRGDDPRTCPFDKMTAEYKSWHQGNRWGAEMHQMMIASQDSRGD